MVAERAKLQRPAGILISPGVLGALVEYLHRSLTDRSRASCGVLRRHHWLHLDPLAGVAGERIHIEIQQCRMAWAQIDVRGWPDRISVVVLKTKCRDTGAVRRSGYVYLNRLPVGYSLRNKDGNNRHCVYPMREYRTESIGGLKHLHAGFERPLCGSTRQAGHNRTYRYPAGRYRACDQIERCGLAGIENYRHAWTDGIAIQIHESKDRLHGNPWRNPDRPVHSCQSYGLRLRRGDQTYVTEIQVCIGRRRRFDEDESIFGPAEVAVRGERPHPSACGSAVDFNGSVPCHVDVPVGTEGEVDCSGSSGLEDEPRTAGSVESHNF